VGYSLGAHEEVVNSKIKIIDTKVQNHLISSDVCLQGISQKISSQSQDIKELLLKVATIEGILKTKYAYKK